jgi:DNA-binding transcriptional LysR family regulator
MDTAPNVDLNLISTFARVVATGSFTAAARHMGLPKSSVSRAVTRLEDSLGVRLLQRTSRKLGLTPAGERYLTEVRGPLARVAEASNEIASLSAEARGVVRLTVAPGMVDAGLSRLLAKFLRDNPRVQIDLLITNRRVSLMEEQVDLAIRAGKLDDSTLIARRIAISELRLFAAPEYLARKGTPRRLQDLAEHDCIVFRSAVGLLPWRLAGRRGVEQVSVTGPVIADDFGAVRALAISGVGVALMPDEIGRETLEDGTLARVLPDYAARGNAVSVVSPPLRHVPTRVTLLRNFLVKEIPAMLVGTPCAI